MFYFYFHHCARISSRLHALWCHEPACSRRLYIGQHFFLPILSAIRDLAPRDLCNPSCDPSAVVCCLGQAGFHDSFPCRGATLSCGERKQGSPHPSAKRRSHHRYHLLRHRVRTYNTLHKCGSVVACPAGSLESEPWRRYLPKRRSMKTMKYALSWQHA